MTEMNELEMELRSLPLRRPSAKLERRLFRQPPAPAVTPEHVTAAVRDVPSFRLSWLAPAAAALLLMGVLFNPRNSATIAGSVSSGPMVALMMSNQSAAAYLPGSIQREHNSLRAETFEWTTASGLTSSIGSLSTGKGAITNE